jgi:hypothetical protein
MQTLLALLPVLPQHGTARYGTVHHSTAQCTALTYTVGSTSPWLHRNDTSGVPLSSFESGVSPP